MPSSHVEYEMNPHNPESFRRSTISSTARDIPGCEMTRTIVAGPVDRIDARTSTWTDASTFPRQQATAALAGRPGTKPCTLITDRVRRRHRTTSVGSRLRASRFNVRRTLGGAESLRKARLASLRLLLRNSLARPTAVRLQHRRKAYSVQTCR